MSGKGIANVGRAQSEIEEHLKLLGPRKELCLESEFTCNRRGWTEAKAYEHKLGLASADANLS